MSALTGLSNLLETLGADGKSLLSLLCEDGTFATDGDASQGREVGWVNELTFCFSISSDGLVFPS